MKASIIMHLRAGDQAALAGLESSIHSVVMTTQRDSLAEIILVDDTGADNDHSALPVRVLTTGGGLGRAASRNMAAAVAVGDVLAFLPVPCKPEPDWLGHLIEILESDDNLVLSPVLHGLDQNLWCFGPATVHKYSWRWDLTLKRPIDESYDWAAVLPGDCLCVTRDKFRELGDFDEVETEELEYSIRAWLCGLSLRPVPQSRVAVSLRDPEVDVRTSCRVAESWFGDLTQRYYDARGLVRNSVDFGDISKIFAVQSRLQRKSLRSIVDAMQPELGPVYDLKGRHFGKTAAIICDGPSLDHVDKWQVYRDDLRIGVDYTGSLFDCDYVVSFGREPVRSTMMSGKYAQEQILLPSTLVGPDGMANVRARDVCPRSVVFEAAAPGHAVSALDPPIANFGSPVHAAVHLAAYMGVKRINLYGWDCRMVDGRSHTALIPHYNGGRYLEDSDRTRARFEHFAAGMESMRRLLSSYGVTVMRCSYA